MMSNTIHKLDKIDVLNLKDKRLRHVNCIIGHSFQISLKKFHIWYTLHCDRESKAFYTSDKKENDKSPKWYQINRHKITNDNFLSLKSFIALIWLKESREDSKPIIFLNLEVHLDDLAVVSDDYLSDNQVLFEIFNHHFSTPVTLNSLKSHEKLLNLYRELTLSKKSGRTSSALIKKSYPLSLMSRLHDFKKVILETECKIIRLKAIILIKYEKTAKIREIKEKKLRIQQRIQLLNESLVQKTNNIKDIKLIFTSLSCSNDNRSRNFIKISKSFEQKHLKLVHSNENKFKELIEIKTILAYRQKQLVHELSRIYSIQDNKINGCSLMSDEQQVAIAIGYIIHCLFLLSDLLNVPLRYPIQYRASKSLIYDLPNGMPELKEFQLFKSKQAQEPQFNKALFLLNKNVVQLRLLYDNFKNIDVNNILGNLKWMLENC